MRGKGFSIFGPDRRGIDRGIEALLDADTRNALALVADGIVTSQERIYRRHDLAEDIVKCLEKPVPKSDSRYLERMQRVARTLSEALSAHGCNDCQCALYEQPCIECLNDWLFQLVSDRDGCWNCAAPIEKLAWHEQENRDQLICESCEVPVLTFVRDIGVTPGEIVPERLLPVGHGGRVRIAV